jgi:hypothetical protein
LSIKWTAKGLEEDEHGEEGPVFQEEISSDIK